jgi:hypothetical protein
MRLPSLIIYLLLALREVAEYIAGQSLSVDVDTVTITQHFPRYVLSPSCNLSDLLTRTPDP